MGPAAERTPVMPSCEMKEDQLIGRLTISMSIVVALVGLLEVSCTKRGEEHTFLRMYTSCNMIGGLEPCG